MSRQVRELQGHGKAIVPHVAEFQECRDGLVIEFYDSNHNSVHEYKDEGNDMRLNVKIIDAPQEDAYRRR